MEKPINNTISVTILTAHQDKKIYEVIYQTADI
jgi:hypothetical protein